MLTIFVNILFFPAMIDQLQAFFHGNLQKQGKIGCGKPKLSELKIVKPRKKRFVLLGRKLGQLVDGICRGIAVGDDDGTVVIVLFLRWIASLPFA